MDCSLWSTFSTTQEFHGTDIWNEFNLKWRFQGKLIDCKEKEKASIILRGVCYEVESDAVSDGSDLKSAFRRMFLEHENKETPSNCLGVCPSVWRRFSPFFRVGIYYAAKENASIVAEVVLIILSSSSGSTFRSESHLH